MMYRWPGYPFFVLILLLVPFEASALPPIYECLTAQGISYSDRPCGPFARQTRVIPARYWHHNLYSGQLRPGQERLLDAYRSRQQLIQRLNDSTGGGESYQQRLERLKKERKESSVKRRHPRVHTPRARSPWR
jgi:hypothetical protein